MLKAKDEAELMAEHDLAVDLNHDERQEIIDDIIVEIRDGLELGYVSYTGSWRGPSPRNGPMRGLVREAGRKRSWLLEGGLWPEECDHICDALDVAEADSPPMHPGTIQEQCVVATLATLLRLRDIHLKDRTVLYVHGRVIRLGGRAFSLPRYSRIALREAVTNDGWDAVADYLAETQEILLRFAMGEQENSVTVTVHDAAILLEKTERHTRRLADKYGLWSGDGLLSLARLTALRASTEWRKRRRNRRPRTDPDGYLPPDISIEDDEVDGNYANIERYAQKARKGKLLFPD